MLQPVCTASLVTTAVHAAATVPRLVRHTSQSVKDADEDLEVLKDCFNLGISLTKLTQEWASKDEHYAFVNERLKVQFHAVASTILLLMFALPCLVARRSLQIVSAGCLWEKSNSNALISTNECLQGCRMMRHDPVECLFHFICSSNNHISRIHGMVNHLCVAYGTKLEWEAAVPLVAHSCCLPVGLSSGHIVRVKQP